MAGGRLTLPIEEGMDDQLVALIERLQPDAVRNSDGTYLPEVASQLVDRVYNTYFPARGDQAWALAHPQEATRLFLMSAPVTATGPDPLEIDIMAGYFRDQVGPDLACDTDRYWQVIDRTTGETLPPRAYRITVAGQDRDEFLAAHPDYAIIDGHTQPAVTVTISEPTPYHRYTVNFLALQLWDSTQMYNYITNGWEDDPHRVKERPYDVRYPQTWAHVKTALAQWLAERPEVNVVRFTTFFYHFTLVFNDLGKEKFVDWFGYSASVSVPALEAFAAAYGYHLTPEDFVDAGYYNSPLRPPTQQFRDWIDFQSRFVAERVRELVDMTHAAGREAVMFLGDNWIGTEPYGPHFPAIGMDAVAGSVGSAATCRMISDIPGVRYTEGRFLPYFFPDVFRPGGDPVGEANESWQCARRAIVRKPLDRIGYGGYLSLAVQFPEFIDRVEEIVTEFRTLHEESAGESPATGGLTVAIINHWGALRTWQTHMVAHALRYQHTYSYVGVIEALAGLPVDVKFLSFADIAQGVPAGIDVLINVGGPGDAFSGGPIWGDVELQRVVREFTARGGGIIGVGAPTAHTGGGQSFALADVFGVDLELGWSLSTDRYYQLTDHFITADLGLSETGFEPGERVGSIVPVSPEVAVLAAAEGTIDIAAHDFGAGRAVYLAGCQYNVTNARLLLRAIWWAAGRDAQWADQWHADDARVEVAYYPQQGKVLAFNNATQTVATTIRGEGLQIAVELGPLGYRWINLGKEIETKSLPK